VQVYVISTPHPQLPASSPASRRFPFAPCLFYHFSSSLPNSIRPSDLPPLNYSFKVVFRLFRDFHSVPVKPLLCSNWNIRTYNHKSLMCSSWNTQPILSPKPLSVNQLANAFATIAS